MSAQFPANNNSIRAAIIKALFSTECYSIKSSDFATFFLPIDTTIDAAIFTSQCTTQFPAYKTAVIAAIGKTNGSAQRPTKYFADRSAQLSAHFCSIGATIVVTQCTAKCCTNSSAIITAIHAANETA